MIHILLTSLLLVCCGFSLGLVYVGADLWQEMPFMPISLIIISFILSELL